MKYIFLFLVPLCMLWGEAPRYELLDKGFPLIYYLEIPENAASYPLVLSIEGKKQEDGFLNSVRPRSSLNNVLFKAGAGLVRLECRGVDPIRGNNKKDFRLFYTFSQDLKDHICLVQYLRAYPPAGWNGQIVIIGRPLAVKLAQAVDASACVAIGACGDLSCQEVIWKEWQQFYTSHWWPTQKLIEWAAAEFQTRATFDEWCQMMKANPDPFKEWQGWSYLYWADILDQKMDAEFLALKCPILLFAGKENVEREATDRLVEKARQNHQDVTYIQVEGVKYNFDEVDPQPIVELLKNIRSNY